VRTLLE
jgi:hypothetical protein